VNRCRSCGVRFGIAPSTLRNISGLMMRAELKAKPKLQRTFGLDYSQVLMEKATFVFKAEIQEL